MKLKTYAGVQGRHVGNVAALFWSFAAISDAEISGS